MRSRRPAAGLQRGRAAPGRRATVGNEDRVLVGGRDGDDVRVRPRASPSDQPVGTPSNRGSGRSLVERRDDELPSSRRWRHGTRPRPSRRGWGARQHADWLEGHLPALAGRPVPRVQLVGAGLGERRRGARDRRPPRRGRRGWGSGSGAPTSAGRSSAKRSGRCRREAIGSREQAVAQAAAARSAAARSAAARSAAARSAVARAAYDDGTPRTRAALSPPNPNDVESTLS